VKGVRDARGFDRGYSVGGPLGDGDGFVRGRATRRAQRQTLTRIKLELVHRPTEPDLVEEVRRLAARLERLERERT
jgi:hypothetical protein